MLPMIGLGLVAIGVYAFLSSEEQEQHERYQHKKRQIRRESERHRQIITQRMQETRIRRDFQQAVAEHHAAVLAGNQMYLLYHDARQVLKGLYEQNNHCQQHIVELKKQRKALMGELREQKHQELEVQYEISKQLQTAIANYKAETAEHKHELDALNHETHRLKLYIRDNMEQLGQQWYARLEARRANK